jgi:hypothetical protein
MDPLKEKLTGLTLAVGVVLAFCGCISTVVFGMGGVFRATYTRTPVTNEITEVGPMNWIPNSLTWFAIGMLMIAGSIGYGIWYNHASKGGTRTVFENARVMSRYGIAKDGTMLNSSWEFEMAESPRFYVRLQTSPHDASEYECDEPVFWQCGEGMYGEAEIQRKWLGRFTPYIGMAQSADDVVDPFVHER